MAKRPIKEIKAEIQDLFATVGDSDSKLLDIIQIFYANGIPPANYKNGFITDAALKRLSLKFQETLNIAPEKLETEIADGYDAYFANCKDAKALLAISLKITQPLYRHGFMETDTSEIARIFKITDAQNQVCTELIGDQKKLGDTIRRGIAESLKSKDQVCFSNTVRVMEEFWSMYDKPLTPVYNRIQTCYAAIFENEPTYDETWCLYKSPHKPDNTIKFPLLKETLDRMSEGDAFAAWIWGVYSRRYQGRQVFWIYGPDGEEGKSYLAKFLGKELFGENKGYKIVNNLKTKNSNQFTTSAYVGARLVVYPDCNNRRILWSELFKSLAGGGRDSEEVEAKYGTSNTVTLDARGMIASNQLPELRRENWLLSRLALCRIQPFTGEKDPNINKKYLTELPGFLAYAKECYEKLCPDDEAIKLKEETIQWIATIIDEQEPLSKDVFLRYFELDTGSQITYKRMKQLMELNEGMKGRDYKDWVEYINSLPGVATVRLGDGYVFSGLNERSALPSAAVVSTNKFKELDKQMSRKVPSFEELEKL